MHTYIELTLAPTLYDQLVAALRAAGADQAFDHDGHLNLHGLAAVKAPATPAAKWRAEGQPDPHGERYDCERAELTLGNLTDDELANEVFMRGNVELTVAQMLAGELGPVAYLTAAKDRIRWLSRALEAAIDAANEFLPLHNILHLCGEEEVRTVQGGPEKLRALIEALITQRRDGARYRWLRKRRTFTTLVNADSSNRNFDPDADGDSNEQMLDDVIDLAIAKERAHG